MSFVALLCIMPAPLRVAGKTHFFYRKEQMSAPQARKFFFEVSLCTKTFDFFKGGGGGGKFFVFLAVFFEKIIIIIELTI